VSIENTLRTGYDEINNMNRLVERSFSGPVPDSYFIDQENAMPDYDQITTVYAGELILIWKSNATGVVIGDKHLIELKVKANTRISWQYMVGPL